MRVRLLVPTAVVAVATLALPGTAHATGIGGQMKRPTPPTPSIEQRLRAAASGPVTVQRDATGKVRVVAAGGAGIRPSSTAARSPKAAAGEFAATYGSLFGVSDPTTMRVAGQAAAPSAGSVVKLQQTVDGLPVIGGELAVAVDAHGAVQAANGEAGRTVTLTPARIPAARARLTALAAVSRAHGLAASDLITSTPAQWVFDPQLVGGFPDSAGGPRRVWRLEVSRPSTPSTVAVRDLVLVDAVTGVLTWRLDEIDDVQQAAVGSPDRVVCDGENTPRTSYRCDGHTLTYARTETTAKASNTDITEAFDNAGRTAAFYANYLGVDLTNLIGSAMDDATKKLRSTVRYCPSQNYNFSRGTCDYANAFWDGEQMVYSDGYAAADDVVAHEMTHGVTQATAGLFYWYQSGAINESMSDVFGEFVDQTDGYGNDSPQVAWLLGEDLPGGAIRSMANPPASATLDPKQLPQPDRMTSPDYVRDVADNGGVHTNSGVGNKAAYLITAGGTFNGHTVQGIGIRKAAAIYYQTLLMLTSGSDYADLGALLPASCDALVARAADSITTSDCTQVRGAVAATEMTQSPVAKASVADNAAAPDAPFCPAGSYRSPLVTDSFETDSGAWTLSTDYWDVYTGYASDGRNHLLGTPPDSPIVAVPGHHDPSAADWAPKVAIPAGAPTYLHFAHAYDFESDGTTYYDGGVVEYSLDSGLTWHDLAALPAVDGYDGATVDGVPGFVGDSHGYVSTRYDLSALAGTTPMFRFRLVADQGTTGQWLGWAVDDVRVYSCVGTPAAPSAPSGVVATASGTTATVSWDPPATEGTGALASYTVTMTPGDRTVTAPAGSRTASFTGLTPGGRYEFTVAAVNDSSDAAGPASAPAALTMPGASTSMVSMWATTTVIGYNGTTTIKGHLTSSSPACSAAGKAVSIGFIPAGATVAQYVGPAWTSAAGWFARTVRPTGSGTYVARYYTHNPECATSQLRQWRVYTRSALSATPSTWSSWRYHTIAVSGRVWPAQGGQWVRLEEYVGGKWVWRASAKLSGGGYYRALVKLPSSGYHYYRIHKVSTAARYDSASRTMRVYAR